MDVLPLVTFFIAFISSILSGIAGGGGGFVMAPYWLISGMTPAQGATTGTFMAIGMGGSSLAALRKTEHFPRDKKLIAILSVVTLLASVFGALILPKIDIQTFKYVLAGLTILALPLIFIKPHVKHRLSRYKNMGLIMVILLLIISSIITSSAFSILIALTLMTFFGMPVLQMTALRRLVGMVQSIVLFIVLAVQGFFIWQHALLAILGGSLGSYIGTKYAVKKGEAFAKYALAAMSLAGAIALLL